MGSTKGDNFQFLSFGEREKMKSLMMMWTKPVKLKEVGCQRFPFSRRLTVCMLLCTIAVIFGMVPRYLNLFFYPNQDYYAYGTLHLRKN